MDRTQLLQKKILPITMIIFIIISLGYYAYVNTVVKSAFNQSSAAFEKLSKSVGPQTQVKYTSFENTPRHQDILTQLKKVEEDIKKILPSIKNFGSVADTLQSFAAECDVEVINLNIYNPTTEASPVDIYPMKIRLECRSTYKAFKKFLWAIENCTNTIFVEKLKFSSSMSEEKLHYTYDFISYIKK